MTLLEIPLEELYDRAYDVLFYELELTGIARFIRQFPGKGDYTRDRHLWLDKIPFDELVANVMRRQEEAKARPPKPRWRPAKSMRGNEAINVLDIPLRELNEHACRVLTRELGTAEMARFIRRFLSRDEYAKTRHHWPDTPDFYEEQPATTPRQETNATARTPTRRRRPAKSARVGQPAQAAKPARPAKSARVAKSA